MLRRSPLVSHVRQQVPGAVFIGRPSLWGNPFRIGRDGYRREVIAKYAAWLTAQPKLMALVRLHLRGRPLACYCRPLTCHGDVLAHVANKGG